MNCNKKVYRERVEKLLRKKSIVISNAILTGYVDSGYENSTRPFRLIQKITTKEVGPRQENLKKAAANFQVVLEECCKAFSVEIQDATLHSDEKDWVDLRGIASYIFIVDLKLSPQRIVSAGLGMANPSMVHHAYYRGKKLIEGKMIYNDKHKDILEAIKDDIT